MFFERAKVRTLLGEPADAIRSFCSKIKFKFFFLAKLLKILRIFGRELMALHAIGANHALNSDGRHSAPDSIRGRLEGEFIQFCDDVLAVGVFAQGAHVRSNLVQQNFALSGLRHVNHLLDHIVGILVLHHHLKATKKWFWMLKIKK